MDDNFQHERRRGKPWYESKVLWSNVISALVAILLLVSQSPSFEPYGEYLLLAQGILNVLLRFTTDQRLTR